MRLEDLNEQLDSKSLEGFWAMQRGEGPAEPRPSPKPHLWKWADIYPGLMAAGDLINHEQAARRTVRLINPGLKNDVRSATRTIHMSLQLIKPGEIAMAHRHNFAAIRFVLRGTGACTVVEGEQFPMEKGDLILTPGWTWHDHFHAGAEPVIWVDGHDGPLIHSLEVRFEELFSQRQQPVERPMDFYAKQFGLVRPTWIQSKIKNPPLRYKWSDTYNTLQTLSSGEGDPYDAVLLRYANPIDGGWTLPTISCEIQMVRPGEKTRSHRHTSSAIYHVVSGSGSTIIDGKRFDWVKGDCFVAPLWSWHEHQNGSDKNEAVLFSLSDRPILESLGLYREESETTKK